MKRAASRHLPQFVLITNSVLEGQFRPHRMEDETIRKKKAAFSAAATCFSYYVNDSVLIKI